MDNYELQEFDFNGKKVAFRISVCPVVNCNCGDMSLKFDVPGLPPLIIDLNIFSREVAAETDDSLIEDEKIEVIRQQFLDSMGDKQWEMLYMCYIDLKHRQAADARLEEHCYIFNFNEIENRGELTTYCDVFPFDVPMQVDVAGETLTVIDYHCLNPSCGCHDSAVEFVNLRDSQPDEEPQSYGIFMLDYQNHTWDFMPGEGEALPGAIPMPVLRNLVESQNPDFYRELAKHHKKLKDLYQIRRMQLKTGKQKPGKKRRR